MAEYENKIITLNADLAGHKKGSKIGIKCEKVTTKIPTEKKNEDDEQKYKDVFSFIPVERYWRDRFKDAKIDNCVKFEEVKEVQESEVISDVKSKKKIPKKPKQ